jgi:[acyl-carrier-protein] S-malonyltransferase
MREVWIFPGQGSQYPGMGRRLYQGSAAAREVLGRAEILSGLPLGSIAAHGTREQLMQPLVLEPVVTALQIAYVDELKKSGAQPDCVAGYSLGELAAFYCTGVISREDALEIAVRRSRILQKIAAGPAGPWRMAAVRGLSTPTLEAIVAELSVLYTIAVAAHNAPDQAAITGESHGVIKAEIEIAARGGVTSLIDVAGPWHCSLVESCVGELHEVLRSFVFSKPGIPLYSSTTGGALVKEEELRRCLAAQIALPVLWNQVLTVLWKQGVRRSLEIGPGHMLTGFVRRTWPNRGPESRFLERENSSNAWPLGFLASTHHARCRTSPAA